MRTICADAKNISDRSLVTRIVTRYFTSGSGGMCPSSKGNLHTLKDQPREGQEARYQELVLYSQSGIWTDEEVNHVKR